MKNFAKSGSKVLWLAVFLLTMAFFTTQLSAGQKVQLEGTFQGVKCTHYKKKCENNDRFIELEPDFVLVMPDGKYYFAPNLTRAVKIRHAYKKVVVEGELTGQEIWVDKIDDVEDSKAKRSWDWSRQDEFWESR